MNNIASERIKSILILKGMQTNEPTEGIVVQASQ